MCKVGVVIVSLPGFGPERSPQLGARFVTDPINNVDLSSLLASDKLEIERLRAAYDRAGPRAVAEGMATLAQTKPDLFAWLVKKLTE